MQLSCGSKAFLCGEYLALQGGPSVVLSLEPRFSLSLSSKSSSVPQQDSVIHPQSPAGLFIERHSHFFSQYHLHFFDPYQGHGGWGASTAQFLLAHLAYDWRNTAYANAEREVDYQALLKSYQELAWDGRGFAPSGADLIGQAHGRICFFQKNTGRIESLSWPFEDLDFLLISTGQKLKTHEHLALLSRFDERALQIAADKVWQSFEKRDSQLLIDGVQSYRRALLDLGFEFAGTSQLIQELEKTDGIRAIKGCGAMGADVVLLLVDRQKAQKIAQWLADKGNVVQASKQQLTEKITMEWKA